MKSNMDELYTRNFAMAKAAEDELFAERHDPSCAYELPEKWEGEPFPLNACDKCGDTGLIRDGNLTWVCSCGKFLRKPQAERSIAELHQTQEMYVLRDGDRVIGYFARKEDAEQRMLVDESVDAERAWVTVR